MSAGSRSAGMPRWASATRNASSLFPYTSSGSRFSKSIRSGLKWWMMAQNPRPFLHEVDMLTTLTLPSVTCLHQFSKFFVPCNVILWSFSVNFLTFFFLEKNHKNSFCHFFSQSWKNVVILKRRHWMKVSTSTGKRKTFDTLEISASCSSRDSKKCFEYLLLDNLIACFKLNYNLTQPWSNAILLHKISHSLFEHLKLKWRHFKTLLPGVLLTFRLLLLFLFNWKWLNSFGGFAALSCSTGW